MKKLYAHPKLIFISILCLTLAFSACKKDKGNDPSSKTDLLTQSSWKMTAYTVDPGFPEYDANFNITGYTTELFSSIEDCTKDDIFKFDANKSIKLDEGASKCFDGDPQSTNGTWSFNPDETILSLTTDFDSQNYTILTLTADVLKVKFDEFDGVSNYTYTITFSH